MSSEIGEGLGRWFGKNEVLGFGNYPGKNQVPENGAVPGFGRRSKKTGNENRLSQRKTSRQDFRFLK